MEEDEEYDEYYGKTPREEEKEEGEILARSIRTMHLQNPPPTEPPLAEGVRKS